MGYYFTITEEMRAMGLSGNDLLVYALISSYSQRGNGCYFGGISFLSEVCGITTRTAHNVLNNLLERELITKNEIFHNGVRYVTFKVCENISGVVKNFQGGSEKIAPNNKRDIEIDKNNNNKTKRFVKPTLEEIKAFCLERHNNIDPERFFSYYESNGWKVGRNPMKNWQRAIITWEKNNAPTQSVKQSAKPQRESTYEHNLRVAKEIQERYGTRQYDDIDWQ